MNYIKVCNYCGGVNGYHEQQCNAVGDNAIIRIAELEQFEAPEPTGDGIGTCGVIHESGEKCVLEANHANRPHATVMEDVMVAKTGLFWWGHKTPEPQAPDAIEVELPSLSPCAVADAANGYFEDALEQREGQLKDEIAAKNALEALQRVHLTALRIVSAALGHPYKNERGKSCIDLANYASGELSKLKAERDTALEEVAKLERKVLLQRAYLATSPYERLATVTQERDAALERGNKLEVIYDACHAREIQLKAELDAALLYGKNRKRDQLKAEMDELRKRYENITVERDDAEIERDRLSAELSELRKQHEKDEVALQHELREIGVSWDRSEEPFNAESGRLSAALGESNLLNSKLTFELSELRKQLEAKNV